MGSLRETAYRVAPRRPAPEATRLGLASTSEGSPWFGIAARGGAYPSHTQITLPPGSLNQAAFIPSIDATPSTVLIPGRS